MGERSRTKVFCIGFQKTGTSSLQDALEQQGYRVAGLYSGDVSLEEMRATYVQRGLEIAERFDAVQDMPWPLLFRELDEAFPGSKFVLTVRDVDSWYRSIAGHFGPKPSPRQQLTYGEDAPTPIGHEQRYREVYLAHNEAVKEYFADRPDDLLILDLERGDGWDKLGPFLGLTDTPTGPFVRSNSVSDRKSLKYRVRQKVKKIMRRLGVPVRTAADR